MKILVLHDEIYPNRSANARIAYCVIDELLKHEDAQITILGRAVKPEQRAPYYKNCPVIHEPYMRQLKADEARRRAGKFSRLKYLYYPRTILTHFAKQPNQYSYEAIRWVKRNAHKFDVILAFTMPFYTLELATLVSNKVPFVFYQMETTYDRPTTHYGLYHVSRNMISRWSSAASRIIATSLLYSTYDKPTISQFKSKVRIADECNYQAIHAMWFMWGNFILDIAILIIFLRYLNSCRIRIYIYIFSVIFRENIRRIFIKSISKTKYPTSIIMGKSRPLKRMRRCRLLIF